VPTTGGPPGAYPARPPGLDGLRGIYERYCDHEARSLLAIIPREGLRAVYSEARARYRAGGTTAEVPAAPPGPDTAGGEPSATGDGSPIKDPMSLAVAFARDLLPLPPYEVWLAAYLRDRRPFLAALGVEAFPAREEPVLVDVRQLGGEWTAGLHLFRRGDEWRGFLCFTERVGGLECRTADIFRGARPEEFRDRFREFHPATLDAFLRSVRP
jgi:hypothetical protein